MTIMKKNVVIFILSLSLFVSMGSAFWFYNRKLEDTSLITLYGNVDVRQVDISFRVSGKVNKLYFEEGDVVSSGDLMCELDPSPYDSQLNEAIALRESIRVNLENAEIGVGAVSREDLDNTRASRDELKENLKQAEANVIIAQDNLDYTKSFAPTKGVILSRIREPGTNVNPTNPVYTLSISSPIWIRAFVDEPNLGSVHYGMEAEVYTDVKGSKVYKGKIGFISPVAEFTPKTVQTTELRTELVYRLRVYVDNPDNELLQGMPVTIKLRRGT
jgi:HlyD family secretion protein